MQKKTIVEIGSLLQRQKTRKDMQKSRNLFFLNWKQQKKTTLCSKKQIKIQKIEKKLIFFPKMSPVCRIVPKTLKSPPC